MTERLFSRLILSGGLLIAASVWAEENQKTEAPDFGTVKNFTSLANPSGFAAYYSAPKLNSPKKIRVAVFDNSFEGFNKAAGKTLPAGVQYFPGITDASTTPTSAHGLKMAEIVWSYATNQGNRLDYEPEMFLFRVSGYSDFQDAISQAILLKVDVIVFSLVRDYGNNFDGKGVFDKEVDRAIKAGIHWINAAGNFALTTFNFNGPFKSNAYGQIQFNNSDQTGLAIRCTPLKGKKSCPVRIVLSWNSYTDNIEAGTDKDLDLTLSLPLKEIARSELRQTKNATIQPGQSKFPREIITADLAVDSNKKSELYYLTVTDFSKNFKAGDKIRISGEGEGLTFEGSDQNESINNPADNANAITVGAYDNELSSKSNKLNKPDLLGPSTLDFADDKHFSGSSNAAALTAAATALLLQRNSNLSRQDLILALTGFVKPKASSIKTSDLGFQPVNNAACFSVESFSTQPPYIQAVINAGGVFVQTTQGYKIMMPVDPIAYTGRKTRMANDDIIAVTPGGWTMVSRPQIYAMPGNWAEVFPWPADYPPCEIPKAWTGKLNAPGTPTTPKLRMITP